MIETGFTYLRALDTDVDARSSSFWLLRFVFAFSDVSNDHFGIYGYMRHHLASVGPTANLKRLRRLRHLFHTGVSSNY